MLNRRERLLAVLILSLGACSTPPAVDVQPDFTTDVQLGRLNPRDVGVLPLEDASPGATATHLLDHMRAQIDSNLVLRRYSPLSHTLVDATLSSASGPVSVMEMDYLAQVARSFDEESAVLAVRLNRWDESDLLSTARVAFQAEAVLVGGAGGATLWSGQISGSVKAGGDGPAPLDPGLRAENAASLFIELLIRNLPSRHL